jgi:cyclomaltodextrinase
MLLPSVLAAMNLSLLPSAPRPLDWPPAPPLEVPTDLAGPLPSTVEAQSLPGGRFRCTFRLPSNLRAQSVHLAGEFNGWDPRATPLDRGADGRWRVTVELPGGVLQYKFVLDGQRWIADPHNPERAPDGQGGEGNSVLRLGRLANLLGGEGGEVAGIETSALAHDPEVVLYRQVLADGRWLLRYRTLASNVDRVELAVRGTAELQPLELVLESGQFDYWETFLDLGLEGSPPAGHRGALEYTFVVARGDRLASHPTTFRLDPDQGSYFTTPEWAKHAVWYQIMVDRFRNGDPRNDPDPVRPWTSEWFTPSPWEGADGQTFWRHFVYQRLYGGDLAGLVQSLDYLQELGVNALYLNPIFQATTPHKYNATNFLHVDEHFGSGDDYAAAEAREDLLRPASWTFTATDRQFLEFLKLAKARGFRVILDAVWNHVGVQHPAFQDVLSKGRRSKFADWFQITSFEPFEYVGWAGFGELPVFDKSPEGLASAAVVEHIFAVTRRWMDPDGDGDPSDGVDGWRLDVPNEIALPFWRAWRQHVKSINPDAYLVGEIWRRADVWLDGRHFDAVMNYPFAEAALRWIGDVQRKITASELDRRLAELRLAYPSESTYVLQNLVDSHDTDRLVSMLHNPDREYDSMNRPQSGEVYDGSRPGELPYRRARLVALLQMTYVGAPMIYYGDEVGMWGADDPTNRKPMLWEDLAPYEVEQENFVVAEHLAHYRRVIALRREYPALRIGDFHTRLTDDRRDLWVFLRRHGDEQVLVALNASDRPHALELTDLLPDGPDGWQTVYGASEQDTEGLALVGAIDGRVWVRRR